MDVVCFWNIWCKKIKVSIIYCLSFKVIKQTTHHLMDIFRTENVCETMCDIPINWIQTVTLKISKKKLQVSYYLCQKNPFSNRIQCFVHAKHCVLQKNIIENLQECNIYANHCVQRLDIVFCLYKAPCSTNVLCHVRKYVSIKISKQKKKKVCIYK